MAVHPAIKGRTRPIMGIFEYISANIFAFKRFDDNFKIEGTVVSSRHENDASRHLELLFVQLSQSSDVL